MAITSTMLGLGALLEALAPAVPEIRIEAEDLTVPSDTPGIELFLRNKRPAGVSRFSGERILLFVHGATYPAETSFDLRLNGLSWMDYIARHGYDVYLVDVRGYGRSTRPPEMDRPAEEAEPIVRTSVAVRDVGTAVNFILQRRNAARLNLLGWSWGTTIMGWYTAQHGDKVNKLVLYAPAWIRSGGASLTDAGGKLPAYRTVSREGARARWLAGVPEARKANLIPPGWFEAWADATFATDPVGSKRTPPVLRAPNGVLADGREFWSAGRALYDPSQIRVPTFLAQAEWDADLPSDMLHAYFEKLTGAPYRRYVQIGEGTHTVMMEVNRMQLFQEVQRFLDESLSPGD
jgi:pimeloyl-ACP methyl ester carboxylesterase